MIKLIRLLKSRMDIEQAQSAATRKESEPTDAKPERYFEIDSSN